MRLVRDLAGPPLAPAGSVVAIGSFDGLHCGHLALLACVGERARELRAAAVAVSFEPLPRAYFSQTPLPRLASIREKLLGFRDAGLEQVLLLHFDAALTRLSPEAFVSQVLVQRLAAREVWVGDDFRYGHRRAGDVALLESLGRQFGFVVRMMPPVLLRGGRASASRIRGLLREGDFETAAVLLGRPFSIEGRVEYGHQLGRTLGYPTANVHLRRRVSPIEGIFAVRVGLDDGPCDWPGVASLGVRPTINQVREPLLEAHLFDFSGDLYGRRIRVEFVSKLRDEEKFSDLEALKTQMRQDECEARQALGMSTVLIAS